MTLLPERDLAAPAVPQPRGPLSAAVVAALTADRPPALDDVRQAEATDDPYGDDLQLALYLLYELHYRGFAAVPEDLEWAPALAPLRAALEDRFLRALRADVPGRTPDDAFGDLLVEPTEHEGSVAYHLEHAGDLRQMREYAALRSLYHLKEADPHVWVVPRLRGRAKAAMVAIEFDEYGGGRAERVHARLFADLMADLGLDTAYGRYVDLAPAEALATTNLMTLFGLRRTLRGALVGHFGCVEVTSSPGSRRLAAGMRRLGAGPAAEGFYSEHVEADAVHEQMVRHEVVGGLLADEPHLAADIAFGVDATVFLEDRLAAHLLRAWRGEGSALVRPLG
ncbi:iron-containing redox enzyme family protein [Streptomyces sp. NBC_01198]|uniref:iron-containing redox enzyme family protein n=1 Tax=Streptomyces sp. NBC_01198 TaxID=2903769 RepID=UPI002E1598C2|nr:iron-containing redox enzyme family protein [Streptomyces sp. NBC_01198]